MRDKFIVHNLLDDTRRYFKSIAAISRVYNVDYFQLYQVYLHTMKKTTRRHQPNNDIQMLCHMLQIHDVVLDFRQNEPEFVIAL